MGFTVGITGIERSNTDKGWHAGQLAGVDTEEPEQRHLGTWLRGSVFDAVAFARELSAALLYGAFLTLGQLRPGQRDELDHGETSDAPAGQAIARSA